MSTPSSNLTIESDGGDVTVSDSGNITAPMVHDIAEEVALAEIKANDAKRQAAEDHRADRRNRNRSYTILVALIMTFAVPYVVANVIHDPAVLKYATGIAIVPDGLITLYAWMRRY